MNWIDIVLLILLTAAAIKGLFKGFIKQLSSLLGVVLGISFSGIFFRTFESFFCRISPDIPQIVAAVLGYIIAFLIIFVTVKLIGLLLKKICKALFLGPIDIILGGLLSVLVCLLIVSLLLNAIDWIDPNSDYLISETAKKNSYLYNSIKSIVSTTYSGWFNIQPKFQKLHRETPV